LEKFRFLPNGDILFHRYHSKNNQRGIQGGSAQVIHLPPGSEYINDITKYLSKRSNDASKYFYLHANPFWRETGIWYKDKQCGINKTSNFMKDIGNSVKVKLPSGLLTNHSGRKTAAQILQNADVPEDAIMEVTGHKSVQGPVFIIWTNNIPKKSLCLIIIRGCCVASLEIKIENMEVIKKFKKLGD